MCWASAGAIGFKGSRKSTPFAAQAANAAGDAAKAFGMRSVEVQGEGARGRPRVGGARAPEAGMEVKSIDDVTPIPHNGCRPRKRRRV